MICTDVVQCLDAAVMHVRACLQICYVAYELSKRLRLDSCQVLK
jgi:hypothetical protein